MIAVSHIDDLLKGAIKYRMVNLTSDDEEVLFSGFGPLATFSARIRIAYALGIVGKKTRHDLDLMREIRNAMAHSRRAIGFDTPEVLKLFRQLHCLKDARVPDKDPKIGLSGVSTYETDLAS